MAGVSGSSSRGQRRAAATSTDTVDQNQAATETTEGGKDAAPAGADDSTPSSSTASGSEGQATGGDGQSQVDTDVTAPSTANGVTSTLVDQVEALTAQKVELQARIASLEAAAAQAATVQPSLDALLADVASTTVWAVEVVGPAAGRWRAGRRFGPEAQTFVEGQLTDAELEAIRADPLLTIGISQVPVHAAGVM